MSGFRAPLDWPEEVSSDHKKAIHTAAQDLQNEFGPRLLGLLLAGSVARFEADEYSDIDLLAIIDSNWYQRRQLRVAGVDVDLFIDCRDRVAYALTSGGNDALVESYADGWVLYDPDQQVSRFQMTAAAIRRGVRRFRQGGELFAHATRVTNALKSYLRTASSDDPNSVLQLHYLIANGLTAYYVFARRWLPSKKGLLNDLRGAAPEFYDLVANLLSVATMPSHKIALAQKFVATILDLDPAASASKESQKFFFKSPAVPVKLGENTVYVTAAD